MKKSNFISFKALTFLVVIFLFSSCLKDDTSPGSENYGNSPALVGFQYNGFAFVPDVVPLLGTPEDSANVEITLSVASITLSTPVTVKIAADQATLDAYNATDTTFHYLQLPASGFTLPNNGSFTIQPGQQFLTFTVRIAGDQVNFSQDNAIAFKMISASGAEIATNLNTFIMILKLKSIYEGDYANAGIITRYNGATVGSGVANPNPTYPWAGDSYFSTVTKNSVDGTLNIPGFSAVEFILTVNDDVNNSVTISSSPNSTLVINNTAGMPSTYDPATHTFTIHGSYLNSAGALRAFDGTLTLE